MDTAADRTPASRDMLRSLVSPEDQAIALVEERADVKQWLAQFSAPGQTGPVTGGRPAFEVERGEGEALTVHVFEDVPDRGDEPGHTATFNWYEVDLGSGRIRPMFE